MNSTSPSVSDLCLFSICLCFPRFSTPTQTQPRWFWTGSRSQFWPGSFASDHRRGGTASPCASSFTDARSQVRVGVCVSRGYSFSNLSAWRKLTLPVGIPLRSRAGWLNRNNSFCSCTFGLRFLFKGKSTEMMKERRKSFNPFFSPLWWTSEVAACLFLLSCHEKKKVLNAKYNLFKKKINFKDIEHQQKKALLNHKNQEYTLIGAHSHIHMYLGSLLHCYL